jgi:hypothetical protein
MAAETKRARGTQRPRQADAPRHLPCIEIQRGVAARADELMGVMVSAGEGELIPALIWSTAAGVLAAGASVVLERRRDAPGGPRAHQPDGPGPSSRR